ncbi:MAG TPA: tyrosine-type recombinase/integrase [Kiritimatiellia bacterium]|nr:tyrosine-type recombinase/integrase [Kiritimatiellia bacterium]HMP33269.1 tyrosine-type recombinase/integrase [Kiritimatiellia bacterium]
MKTGKSKTEKRGRKHAWPKIGPRGKAWRVDCGTVFGRRLFKQFPTLPEAEAFAAQMRTAREEQKRIRRIEHGNRAVSLFKLTDTQRADVLKAYDLLGGSGRLLEAVEFFLKHNPHAAGGVPLRAVLDDYVASKDRANRRERTLKDIEHKVGRFVATGPNRPVHSVTTDEIDAWLTRQGYRGASWNAYRRAFVGLFNFAMTRGQVASNPANRLPIVKLDAPVPEIHTPAQVRVILQAAATLHPELVPYFAIGYFTGLRPARELGLLDWRDVDLRERLILVSAHSSKTREQRFVKIADNLLEWLTPYHAGEGRIPSSRRHFRDILKAAKVEWPRDVMRHTFASYHLAHHEDAAKTAHEMGHADGGKMLFTHYRNLVKPSDAGAFWNISPEAAPVIRMPRAVSA